MKELSVVWTLKQGILDLQQSGTSEKDSKNQKNFSKYQKILSKYQKKLSKYQKKDPKDYKKLSKYRKKVSMYKEKLLKYKKNDKLKLINDIHEALESKEIDNSPLLTFFESHDMFFETYWPALRNWIQRQNQNLIFDTPSRLTQDMQFEFFAPMYATLPKYLYVCGLSEYLPGLEIKLDETPQVIMKAEDIVSIIIDKLSEVDPNLDSVVKHIIDKRNLKKTEFDKDFREDVRKIYSRSKPLFFRFTNTIERGENHILSIKCIGNPFEFADIGKYKYFEEKFINYEEYLPKKDSIDNQDSLLDKLILKFWDGLRMFIFPRTPLSKPQYLMEIYSKNPSESVWINITAPKKFHLEFKDKQTSDEDQVEIKDVSSKDPEIASFRVGSYTPIEKSWQCRLNFSIIIPKPHRRWLGVINFISIFLIVIWASALLFSFGWLKWCFWLDFIGERVFILADRGEFFAVTFTFISFIIVAREWLIYEKTVFKLCSKRLAFHVSFLIFLSVVFNLLF